MSRTKTIDEKSIALDIFLAFFIYSTHSKESCYHFTAIALNMLAWSVCPGSRRVPPDVGGMSPHSGVK